jgi:hypothetical protein
VRLRRTRIRQVATPLCVDGQTYFMWWRERAALSVGVPRLRTAGRSHSWRRLPSAPRSLKSATSPAWLVRLRAPFRPGAGAGGYRPARLLEQLLTLQTQTVRPPRPTPTLRPPRPRASGSAPGFRPAESTPGAESPPRPASTHNSYETGSVRANGDGSWPHRPARVDQRPIKDPTGEPRKHGCSRESSAR